MKRKEKGFTLTETMISVAVIGVITAIAIPSYKFYTGNAHSSEVSQLMEAERSQLDKIKQTKSCTAVAGKPDIRIGPTYDIDFSTTFKIGWEATLYGRFEN